MLNEEMEAFFDAYQAAYPTYRKLERDAGAYFEKR